MADKPVLSVPPSLHMSELLGDRTLCKNVATIHADLERVLGQIQRDIVTNENRDTVGPTLLALKHVQDILMLFKTKGDMIITQENQADAKAKRI